MSVQAAAVTVDPHFGHTKVRTPLHPHGLPVHLHAIDHMPVHNVYARFNKRCATWITKNVGSMSAFWIFTGLSMVVAPSCLYAAGYIDWKSFITSFGFELLATLILSTWLELALMPAIMVGTNLASAAADARAAKTFEDVEELRADMRSALDLLNTETQGGLQLVMARLGAIEARMAAPAQE